jgi:predicted component of type VI protein secretion system
MSSTRRPTPVAPAPQRPASSQKTTSTPHVLKAPVVVVTPNGEWELEEGSIVIGRAEEAKIVIDDPLVSRMHARISVLDDERVVIEDLNSTNGVFVNGVRLPRPLTGLAEGDRLLIGTTEVSVFSTRSSATVPVAERLAPEPARQATSIGNLRVAPAVQVSNTLPSAGIPSSQRGASAVPALGSAVGRPVPPTERSQTVELVGRLAEHFMASGLPGEAVRVLSEHLNTLLLGASAGLAVPEPLLDHATRYALKLFTWTSRASWIDYPLELHAACQQTPSHISLSALEAVYPTAKGADRGLVDYLLRTLRAREAAFSREEEHRLTRLGLLVRRG